MNKIIHVLRKLKVKISKTDFVIEAIQKKLDKEEKDTKKLLQKLLETTSITIK